MIIMNKLLVINKEKGYTSRDVVNIISKIFKTKSVGHFGTLDPLATGVLLVGIGKYTKLGNYLPIDDKKYVAKVLIGTSTDTYDIQGKIIKEEFINEIDENKLKKIINSFKKTYLQEVPIYSAVKVNGKKLYEYARNNEEVILPKKEVTIYDINLVDIVKKEDRLYFSLSCHVSKGTYIRSLINDISNELGIPLAMSELERISHGDFNIEKANSLKDIEGDNYTSYEPWDIINIKKEEVTFETEKKVINGNKMEGNYEYILYTKDGNPLVLYKKDDPKYLKPIIFH